MTKPSAQSTKVAKCSILLMCMESLRALIWGQGLGEDFRERFGDSLIISAFWRVVTGLLAMSVMICIGTTPLIWSVYLYVLCPHTGTLPRNPPHYGSRKLLQLAHPDVRAYYRNLEEDQARSQNVDAPNSAISQGVLPLFVGDSDSPSHRQRGTDNSVGQGSSAVQGRAAWTIN